MSSTLRSPARVLLVVDQPILAEVIKLALNHGVFRVQVTQAPDDVLIALRDWHPHLLIIDMDLAAAQVLDQLELFRTRC